MKNLIAQGVPEPKGGINNPALGDKYTNTTGVNFFQTLLPRLVTVALIVGSLIFVFMLITGAIAWISSGGDKQAIETAKGKISNALIGIIILLAVFAVIKLIEVFFGISILALDIGSLIIE